MMPATTPTSLLALETDVWKTRAHAKQKWLERTRAEPPKTSRDHKRQTAWIKQALQTVKHGHEEIKHKPPCWTSAPHI